MTKPKTVKIDDVEYVRADAVTKQAEKVDGMEYCIVRTYSAGVFAGYLASQNGKEAVVKKARRLWYWDGAASLSQLAMEGVSNPSNCKFPCEVTEVRLTDVVETIPATEAARKSIAGVPIWKR